MEALFYDTLANPSLAITLNAISLRWLGGHVLGEVARKPTLDSTHSTSHGNLLLALSSGCGGSCRSIDARAAPATNVGGGRPRLLLLLLVFTVLTGSISISAGFVTHFRLVAHLDEPIEPSLAAVRDGEHLADLQRHGHRVAGEDGPRHRTPAARRDALAADAEQRAARERPRTRERYPRAHHAELLAALHLLALLLQLFYLHVTIVWAIRLMEN